MSKINIKLIKSFIGLPEKHKAVLRGLGLKKVNGVVELNDTPEIRGMLRKISHCVTISE